MKARRESQRGLSLIEILVALTIGLFLMVGLVMMVQSNQKAFASQTALTQLQDTERFTLTAFAQVIEQAGWYPDPTTELVGIVFPADARFPAAGVTVYGVSAASPGGDSVSVRFQSSPTDGLETCTGSTNATAANVLFENVLSVDAAGNLLCAVNGAPAVVLTTGVSQLSVQYGVKRTIGQTTTTFDTYVPASAMAAADWANVVCVKVTVSFANPITAQAGQPATIALTRVIAVMNRSGVNT